MSISSSMDGFKILQYNPNDETRNFGGRMIGNDLFESITLLSVEKQSSEEILHISSYASQNKLYLAIDNNLWILSDLNQTTADLSIRFSYSIDTFKLIDNFLLLGLNNGEIQLIDTFDHTVVANCALCENVWFGSKYFIGIYQEEVDIPTFLVLTKKGQFFRVEVNVITKQLKAELIVELSQNITIACYANHFLVAIGSKVIVYDSIDKITDELKLENVQFKKIMPLDLTTCIAQGSNGSLWLLNLGDFPCFAELALGDKMDDFNFYSYKKNAYIYYVTDEKNSIKMMKFDNERTEVFSINVHNFEQLIYTNEEHESQMYLTREVNRIHINLIQESQPEDRLQRLLSKLLYDEAEAFAKEYNLSRLQIDKAKVKNYTEKLSCTDEDIDELLALLPNIPNDAYTFVICQEVISNCETITGVKKLLKFWSSLNIREVDDPRAAELLLNENVASLDTVTTLSRCMNEEVTVAKWQRFYKHNLFEYLISCLLNSQLEMAIVIFSRLNAKHFTKENIATVLRHLGDYTQDQYTSFLNTMIPTTLLNLPSALDMFVVTIGDKVHKMEQLRREIEFPEKAIAFVDNMLHLIQTHGEMVSITDSIEARQSLQPLMNVSTCLETILELKNNFGVYLPLQDCLDGPGAMLRALLRVKVDSLDKFLKHFLVKFMLRNNLNADAILAGEIKAMQNSKYDYWSTEIPQVWSNISSTSLRIDILLNILQSAPTPWCDGIRRMIADAVKFNHTQVIQLQSAVRNEDKYIVLNRDEYQLRGEKLIDVDHFTIQRLIYCNLPTLIDDMYTICTRDRIKRHANFCLLVHFIQAFDAPKIYELIQRFTSKETGECIISLSDFFQKDTILTDTKLRQTLIKSLEILADKIKPNPVHTSCIQMFKVIDMIPSDMISIELFDKLLSKQGKKEVFEAIIREISISTENFEELLKHSRRYAKVFAKTYEYILFSLCQVARNPQLTFKTAKHLYGNSEDVSTMCLFAVFVLSTIGNEQEYLYGTFFNNTIGEEGEIPLDEVLLKKTLLATRLVINKAFMLSESDLQVATISKWVYIQNKLISDVLKDGSLDEIQISTEMVKESSIKIVENSSMCTLSALSQIFNKVCTFHRTSLKNPNKFLAYSFLDKPKTGDDDDDEDEAISLDSYCKQIVSHLGKALPSIQREVQHWTLQQVLVTLQSTLVLPHNENEYESMQKLVVKVKNNMLTHVFASSAINSDLAFTLLMSYPRKKALTVINEAIRVYRENFTKFEDIVNLGVRLTTTYKSTDHYGKFIWGIKWRKRLTKCTMPTSEFFLLASNKELLGILISQHEITLEEITEFCEDFKMDAQTYYLKYLNDLIATWKPKYVVNTNLFGLRSAVVEEDTELDAKCLKTVALLKDRQIVLDCINTLWESLNFYYYEAYLAILNVATALNDMRHGSFRVLLHFLRKYQRVSKPTELETEEWFSRMAGGFQSLDPISEWRFPFSQVLFTTDLWKLLRWEIKLTNYVKWFENVDVLKNLKRDEICSYVVKDYNFIYESKDNSYRLQPTFEDIFSLIDTCLEYISDKVLAASMAFHLLPKPAEGADRVIAAKMAYKYAKRCKESGAADNTYKQIEKMYFSYTSKHILHMYNLASTQYLHLLNDPDALINALYRDERILKGPNVTLSHCPDINRATDELGALFHIDIRAKRIQLLTTFLNDNHALGGDADMSIYLTPEMNYTGDVNAECVLRAAYICSSGDVAEWREHLYEMFDRTMSEQCLIQGRLLKTICMITSPEELIQRYDCPYNDIMTTIDNFFIVNDLNSLGIMIDFDKYTSMDKTRLLYKLGKKLSDPLNVKVMIAICQRVPYDQQTWEKITRGMIELKMIDDLKKCLLNFTKLDILISKEIYCNAWQLIVDDGIKSLNTSRAIQEDLTSLIYFIQGSPVLNQLNLREAYQKCLALKKPAYALLFLQYEEKQCRDCCLAELLQVYNKETLREEVKKLENLGFIGFHHVKYFVEEA